MLTLSELANTVRRARVVKGHAEVSPEYRGWNFERPPVRPPAYLGLALSDFAYGYCPTGRSLYLKYVAGERPTPTRPLVEGSILHGVLFRAMEDFKKHVYSGSQSVSGLEGVPEEYAAKAQALYRYVLARYMGELHYVRASGLARGRDSAVWHVVPMHVQVPVDGAVLGLSRAVVDAVGLGAVVEFKFGPAPNVDVALAGYAMALEAEYGVPVDLGIAVHVTVDGEVHYRAQAHPLDDAARRRFIEARDEAIDIVESGRDPGTPPKCPRQCPFYPVCHADSGG